VAHAEPAHVMLPVPASYTGRQEVDLDVVREILSHFTFSDYEEAQELILFALQEINEHFGWVSPEAAELVAEHLNTTVNRVYGLLTFYADFRTEPRGHEHMLICHGMACYVRGSQELVQAMQDDFGVIDGETTQDANVSIQVVNGCLGVCDRAPVVKINDDYHGFVTPEQLTTLVNQAIEGRRLMAEKGTTDGHHASE
jgi:NADH-quinone oxidoreductase subunit E